MESYKTYDDNVLIKSADIGQVMIFFYMIFYPESSCFFIFTDLLMLEYMVIGKIHVNLLFQGLFF